MNKTIIPLFTPIVSCFILAVGNGFYTTFTTVQLATMNFSSTFVGIISAVYFAGMLFGSLFSQKIIVNVKHIRAYSVFAAIMTICCLFQGVFSSPYVWMILRFLAGYSIAGLFIVLESWCVSSVESNYRGRIIGLYLFSYYIAQVLGQLLIKYQFDPVINAYCLVAGLACFSIIPVSLTRYDTPKPESPEFGSIIKYFKVIPIGMSSAFVAGGILAVIYTILPLAYKQSGYSDSKLATVMAVTIFGGVLSQLPIGKLSDMFDRRKVILTMLFITFIFSSILAIFHHSYIQVLIFTFLVGFAAFAIYPVTITHSADRVDVSKAVAVISVLTLFYSLGSVTAPLVVTPFIQHFGGITGFYSFLAIVTLLLGLFVAAKIKNEKPVKEDDKVNFSTAALNTSVGMSELIKESFNAETIQNLIKIKK